MKINLDKDFKYVVGVSFGPDSMALLDILNKLNYDVIVCHVNYHKRKESDYEEKSLKEYCSKRNIQCFVFDTKGMVPIKNFQNWAREIRYRFFKQIADKCGAKAVLVAHQQDDLIETYLMQINRKSYVKYWGIAGETELFGIKVIRPLLTYKKCELLRYCEENSVPYSIDSSNLENHYTRNIIRHSSVEKMSNDERTKIIEEIKKRNLNICEIQSNTLSLEEFEKLSYEQLISFINNSLKDSHINLSNSFYCEILKAMNSDKNFVEIKLKDNVYLTKDYQKIKIVKKESFSYSIQLKEPGDFENDLFKIDFSLGALDRNVYPDSYPITIKPVRKDEYYGVKDYQCKVNRLFIDWKVPHELRNLWPGIYDKNNNLIYIPRYREKYIDDHKSILVIKFAKK